MHIFKDILKLRTNRKATVHINCPIFKRHDLIKANYGIIYTHFTA